MKNSVNLIEYLNAYNLVCKEGEKNEQGYTYMGLIAWQDFDGYTCYLSDSSVTMTFLFHGKYQMDYETKDELEKFTKKVTRLC